MPRPLKWVSIVFAMLSVSCTTSHDIWLKYEVGGQHRAYAIGSKGAAGAVWNYSTSGEAVEAAKNLCLRAGGIDCRVTHLNGKPYFATSLEQSEAILAMDETSPKVDEEIQPAIETSSQVSEAAQPTIESSPEVSQEIQPILTPVPTPAHTLLTTGTGFLLGAKGQIITNAHVVKECSLARVLYQDNVYDVSLIKVDQHNDLALLQSTISGHRTAQLEIDRIPRRGEPVIAFGYPLSSVLSAKPEATDGVLSSTAGLNDDSRYLQISAPIQPGNSGGPLLDQFGRVIGVVTAELGDIWSLENRGAVPRNVNFALKSLLIKAFLDSNSVVIDKSGQASQAMSLPDIEAAADLYTVQIGCFK